MSRFETRLDRVRVSIGNFIPHNGVLNLDVTHFRALTIAVAAVCALYLVLVPLSRPGGEQAAPSASRFRPGIDTGTGLRILNFYSGKAVATRGEAVPICYSVQEASKVEVQPPIGEMWPSFNRCLVVRPKQDTTYTLTAEGSDGRRISSAFTLHVVPPPAEITLLAATREIPPGDFFTVCYGVQNAVSVVLQPIGQALPPSPKNCFRGFTPRTTKFELIATGEDGKQARGTFRVRVKPL